MLFWIVAAALVLGCLLVVFAPLIGGAGRAAPRASYDIQIYRDQLREIDRDLARGVISPEEAEDSRLEISRKLLAAADAEARERAGGRAPRAATLAGGSLAGLAALGLTIWVYGGQGVPGYRDQPLAERLARQAEARANRPRQAEVEAMVTAEREAHPGGPAALPGPPAPRQEEVELVERLQEVLRERPDELEGHRLLARSLWSIGRFSEARAAQERVVAILGEEAGADDLVALAEVMIAAAAGYVSPEAESLLSRALAIEPGHQPGRYYSGLTLLQGGRPDLAYRLWAGLLEEGPPDAPWIEAIEADIEAVAMMAGMPVPGTGIPRMTGGGEASGPADVMQQMATPADGIEGPDAETMERIEGMVASLGARLATEGGTAEEWAQLIRSLGVLGRIGEAAAIWSEAQDVFAGDSAALARLSEAARDARLIQ